MGKKRLEAQLFELRKLAKRNGLSVVREPFVESKFAKNPNNRPEFLKVLKTIESGKAQGILCWQINRLANVTALARDGKRLRKCQSFGLLVVIKPHYIGMLAGTNSTLPIFDISQVKLNE